MKRVSHRTRILEHGEGVAQAACECGWHSEQFGVHKLSTMDALQQAKDAADLHEWETSLTDS